MSIGTLIIIGVDVNKDEVCAARYAGRGDITKGKG